MLMELLEARHSIRRYTDRPVSREDMEQILRAGAMAPNAGGAQRSLLVGVPDPDLTRKLGRWNLQGFRRDRLLGSYVSREQPSVIDDPSIRDGFYGAPAAVVLFGQRGFRFREADAFCSAENMLLMATELGLASCIVSRGEETFASPEGQALLRQWAIPEDQEAVCFVILGYREGPEPGRHPLRENRIRILGGEEKEEEPWTPQPV